MSLGANVSLLDKLAEERRIKLNPKFQHVWGKLSTKWPKAGEIPVYNPAVGSPNSSKARACSGVGWVVISTSRVSFSENTT